MAHSGLVQSFPPRLFLHIKGIRAFVPIIPKSVSWRLLTRLVELLLRSQACSWISRPYARLMRNAIRSGGSLFCTKVEIQCVGSRPSVVMTSWIHTRNQAYLGMYIRCVACRISDIRCSAGLEIRSYGYGIPAEIRPFGIPGFYGIPTCFW